MPTSARGRDPAVEEEFLGALHKGGELLASGKIVEAREHLEKAHGLAPKNEKAQNLLGLAYFKLGLFDQASEVYEKLVNENPTDATLRVNLGLVYLKTNNLERCIKEFETATDLEPTHKKAHNYLGLALAQQGTYVKAKEHFELAGSDQMADKMARAIAAQSTPSGMHEAPTKAPVNVVIGGEPPAEAPRAETPPAAGPPPLPTRAKATPAEEEPIEVMSDEEAPSDAYVVPEESSAPPPTSAPALGGDWGAELQKPAQDAAPRGDEMRFAEDEGPPEASLADVEELPVVDAVVEAMPEVLGEAEEPARAEASTPAWLTMEAAEASRGEQAQVESAAWVTETVSGVPLSPEPPTPGLGAEDPRWAQASAPVEQHLAQPDSSTEWVTNQGVPADPAWAQGSPVVEAETQGTSSESRPPVEQSWAAHAPGATADGAWPVQEAAPSPDDPSWPVTQQPLTESGPAALVSGEQQANDDGSNSASAAASAPPGDGDGSWATPGQQVASPTEDTSSAAENTAAQPAQAAQDDASWATGGATEQPSQPAADDAAWATGGATEQPAQATADDASWATGGTAEQPAQATADDASWATGTTEQPAQATADDASWATGGTAEQPAQATADDASWATGTTEQPAQATADDASWATGTEEQPSSASADSAWVTAPANDQPLSATADDASWATGPAEVPAVADDASWATGAPAAEAAAWTAAPPAPEPSAPISITVEEPQSAAPPAPAAAPAHAPVPAPAGYQPMSPQRLVDLGASGAWVQEPTAGPFHVSQDGLAVTVSGEMLVRMNGLVAIVGSVEVTPENKRRRGRSSGEPFGTGPNQLQRAKGNGVLYLEPGRAQFHAVDLTDQGGVKVDDDGAYLREELVFAFEEAISFDNGRLSAEGQSIELAHLKGNGRVLLQLEGSLRAMPIPLGAPMMVPLQRLVGWFGRVTPRLMGFGGRGAIELTGEGYALLGTPPEGR